MPHQDGPLFAPIVAVLCLGSSSMLEFWDSLAATKRTEVRVPASIALVERD